MNYPVVLRNIPKNAENTRMELYKNIETRELNSDEFGTSII